MATPRELRDARKRLESAANELLQIEALPRRKGSKVRWSNGVVWTRMGDDVWVPDEENTKFPSAHVATVGRWEVM